jgi:hypothetical protein
MRRHAYHTPSADPLGLQTKPACSIHQTFLADINPPSVRPRGKGVAAADALIVTAP